jgi:D-alanyl-D-alanine carboxypeptidase
MHKKLLVAAMLAVTASAGAFAQAAASGAVAVHPTPAKPAIFVAEAPRAASAVAPHAASETFAPARQERIVTREEFLKKAAEHFDAMDANHDGKVTSDERHAFIKAHVAEWNEQHPKHDGVPPQDAAPAHLPK